MILESYICRGDSGSEKFLSTHIIARGDIVHEGVYTREVLSQYTWAAVSISLLLSLYQLSAYLPVVTNIII